MEKFFYRVEEGDTLLSLSERFHIPPRLIIAKNNLTGEILCGDILYIENDGCSLYKVKPFDTLEELSEKFGVPKEKILLDNGVDYIFYGLTIKI